MPAASLNLLSRAAAAACDSGGGPHQRSGLTCAPARACLALHADRLARRPPLLPGCKEVTTVPAKPGIAFIEFETEMQATVAMTGLQGFKVTPQNAMKITYSK